MSRITFEERVALDRFLRSKAEVVIRLCRKKGIVSLAAVGDSMESLRIHAPAQYALLEAAAVAQGLPLR